MGKQQTKHSLPHSASSVDTANELNTFHARFDVLDFSEDCATLCETVVPEQLDLSEADVVTKPLVRWTERLDFEKLFDSAGEYFYFNLTIILGLTCYASCLEKFHNNTCAQESDTSSTE